MPDPLRPLLDHLAERYDIERELGGGGMSRVFLANERALGRRVVIKVLSPELGQRVNIDRFLQEVATSATLQHPQIVPVLHAGGEDGMRYYVMPFIAGESLRARLQREGKLDGRDVLHLIAPLARALAYAHRQGIVHRDVKPENILLSEGEPMLADFGIAKVVREDNNATGLTSAGMSIGTVTYMPPEQVVADPGIDGRADVYSLAAVAYELLTGQPPFTGTPAQVMSAHVVKPPADLAGQLAEADMALGAVIMRGLEKEPAQRPDAESFAAMLEEARGQPVSASRPALVAPVPRGGQRGTIMAIALAVAAVVAALVWRTPGSDAGTALAATPAIAVLNFEMIGPRDDAYLSAGGDRRDHDGARTAARDARPVAHDGACTRRLALHGGRLRRQGRGARPGGRERATVRRAAARLGATRRHARRERHLVRSLRARGHRCLSHPAGDQQRGGRGAHEAPGADRERTAAGVCGRPRGLRPVPARALRTARARRSGAATGPGAVQRGRAARSGLRASARGDRRGGRAPPAVRRGHAGLGRRHGTRQRGPGHRARLAAGRTARRARPAGERARAMGRRRARTRRGAATRP
ncbi:MAG: protein kinase [Gemmatimonadetes bacterium]|nr:protein kinase [Gemmatimonadota bacterium]